MEDLSHKITTCSDIGRIQTLTTIPVVAGDRISLSLSGSLELAPYRRRVVLDPVCTIAAFWQPYRHHYGDDWENFIKAGYDETVDLPTETISADTEYLCWGFRTKGTKIMRPIPRMYNDIFNWYWRLPLRQTERALNSIPSGEDALYGIPGNHLPSVLTGAAGNITFQGADYEVPVTSGKFDIRQFDKVRAQYKSEIEREWFNKRYTEVMQGTWGSGVGVDADQRPTMLMVSRQRVGGSDQAATDDAGLGMQKGSASVQLKFGFPKKHFAEHGLIMVQCCLRYPVIHHDERHYFAGRPNPSYLEIAGDPELIANEQPRSTIASDYFKTTNGGTIGLEPYGQWYRFHPALIHPNWEEARGYPYRTDQDFVTNNNGHRFKVDPSSYNELYDTLQYRHWQAYAHAKVMADRKLPPAISSIYAGA